MKFFAVEIKNLQIRGKNLMFKPCIDMTSLNNNQLIHSQFCMSIEELLE